ncbi:MAG: DNA polymerase III subunit delta' [Paludibacteraceae bacterium]|nr:DNA polymerase III subunit delta' [Paludibacteraceae bacterium]
MLFKEIYGQEAIKQTFTKAVSDNRLAHAILLYGPQGTGKLALAIALAQYVNCPNRKDGEACGTCPSCIQFQKLVHPDLHFVFPITRSSDSTTCDTFLPEWRQRIFESPYFNLEQWERLINQDNKQSTIYTNESNEILKKLSAKAYESEYKVMIIWLPEKMQEDCANKLLKIIEEPPSKTLFILVSEEPEKLLQTITSRTQRFFIPPLTEEEIANALNGKFTLSSEELANVSHIANGNLIKAINIIESSTEENEYFNLFISLMRLCYQRKAKEMKEWSEEIAKIGRKRQITFLEYAQRMVRENFIYNLHEQKLNYLTQQEAAFSMRFAPFINEKNIAGFLSELESAAQHIEQNVQAKIVFFDLSLKITMLIKMK